MDLSIIIPTFNEANNIASLIDTVKAIMADEGYVYEIIVADAGSRDNTLKIAEDKGARVFIQGHPGYGGALKDAIKLAKGKYIVTMDADLSHNPYIIKRLYSQRNNAHIVVASRYIRGGVANMPFERKILSILLNRFSCFVLSLPFKDITSGFRLYNSEIFKEIDFSEKDFSVLTEILIKAYMCGFRIMEAPFHYQPRKSGKSHAKIIKFGLGFLITLVKLWKLRNSIASADYDDRAYNSRIPPQRFWQRQRYKIIYNFVGFSGSILDIGCGTSKILGAFPQSIGMDINFNKLRYNLSLGNALVNADIRHICFKDASFDVVICSQVIEHIEKDQNIFKELSRIIKKNGTLIIGTPDYSRLSWVIIEWFYKKIIPGGYADEHITHFTRQSLVRELENLGFKLQAHKYILGSELICKFEKLS